MITEFFENNKIVEKLTKTYNSSQHHFLIVRVDGDPPASQRYQDFLKKIGKIKIFGNLVLFEGDIQKYAKIANIFAPDDLYIILKRDELEKFIEFNKSYKIEEIGLPGDINQEVLKKIYKGFTDNFKESYIFLTAIGGYMLYGD